MILNNKGITLIESLVAVVLTAIAILGLMTMQPLSWKTAGNANSRTQATLIMQSELESIEGSIMSGTVPSNKTNVSTTMGNETFTVNTTITQPSTVTWLAHVHVTWHNNSIGVKSSILVTRQVSF